MRILIVAVGTAGDVLPYTGLGARLQAAGHEVTIAAHAPFEAIVRARGFGFHPLPMDPREELESRDGQRVLRTSPLAAARYARMYARHWGALGEAIEAAAGDADLLLLSAMGWLGIHVAEGLGIPSLGVYLQPLDSTTEFPPWLLTTRSLGRRGNRVAADLARTLGQWPFRGVVADLRARLGLAPITPTELFRRLDARRWPIYYAFSPTVVPTPADWQPGREVVGYLWPEPVPGWRPPAELCDFLAAGPPPVFVGFGSMPASRSAELGETVVRALRDAGARGIIQGGHAGLSAAASEDFLTIGEVPHDWLFPRTAAVVHHGGAGTSAAGLRAGVPAVAVPLAADQPFWAQHLVRLGISPGTVAFRRLDAESLGNAVHAVTASSRFRDRSAALARRIAAEDGAGAIVRGIERRFGDGR